MFYATFALQSLVHKYFLIALFYILRTLLSYPDRICLIRGNHECRQITQVYGFYGIFSIYMNLLILYFRRMPSEIRISYSLEILQPSV